RVQQEVDRAFQLVGRQARLPGFRPGKAPRAVLERMFGEQVRQEVFGRLVEESFHHAVQQHHLDIVGTPEVDAKPPAAGAALLYTVTVDVRPAIALQDLGGLEVTRPDSTVPEAEVDRVLEALRESVAQLRPVEGRSVVEAGDVLTLNLTSRLDG